VAFLSLNWSLRDDSSIVDLGMMTVNMVTSLMLRRKEQLFEYVHI